MDVRWFYYRAKGSGWLHVNGTVYRAENMDQALDMLDGIVSELVEKEEEEIQNDHEAENG
jgi:hypothetical protein